MLSGIGPAEELNKHGIPPIHVAPQVGQNLQDHLDYTLSYKFKRPDTVGLSACGAWQLARAGLRWRKDGSGLFASPMAEGGGFFRTSPDLERPDIQLHFVVGIVDDHMRKLHYGFGYSCHVCVLRPESRGHVRLRSADPLAAPRIDPNFLSSAVDLEAMTRGARVMEQIMQAEALTPWRGKKLFAHDAVTPRLRPIFAPVPTRSIIRWALAAWAMIPRRCATCKGGSTGWTGCALWMRP